MNWNYTYDTETLGRAQQSMQPWELSTEDAEIIKDAMVSGAARPAFEAKECLPYDKPLDFAELRVAGDCWSIADSDTVRQALPRLIDLAERCLATEVHAEEWQQACLRESASRNKEHEAMKDMEIQRNDIRANYDRLAAELADEREQRAAAWSVANQRARMADKILAELHELQANAQKPAGLSDTEADLVAYCRGAFAESREKRLVAIIDRLAARPVLNWRKGLLVRPPTVVVTDASGQVWSISHEDLKATLPGGEPRA
jgi:hypothetical protein